MFASTCQIPVGRGRRGILQANRTPCEKDLPHPLPLARGASLNLRPVSSVSATSLSPHTRRMRTRSPLPQDARRGVSRPRRGRSLAKTRTRPAAVTPPRMFSPPRDPSHPNNLTLPCSTHYVAPSYIRSATRQDEHRRRDACHPLSSSRLEHTVCPHRPTEKLPALEEEGCCARGEPVSHTLHDVRNTLRHESDIRPPNWLQPTRLLCSVLTLGRGLSLWYSIHSSGSRHPQFDVMP